MYLSCQSIPTHSINSNTEWNLHPWDFKLIPVQLQEDFRLHGILHPPLVIADSEKTFTLVSGARRMEFISKFISPSRMDCMVIDQEASIVTILNLILADQRCTSGLSLAEKARFAEIANRFLRPDEIVATFGKRLQLHNSRLPLGKLLQVVQLDETIVRAIHAGHLQDRMVGELLSLSDERDRLALVRLFDTLGMGDGKQKRFLTFIRDIAFRAGLSIASYLQESEITAILDHKEMNNPQKIHHLSTYLQSKINPTVAQTEAAFQQKVKSLQLPPNSSISHSPSFEKDTVTLSITFENFDQCEHYLKHQA